MPGSDPQALDMLLDGRENPLAIADANRLEKAAPFVSLTGHVWSGFILIGSLAFWKALLGDIQDVVQRASVPTRSREAAVGPLPA